MASHATIYRPPAGLMLCEPVTAQLFSFCGPWDSCVHILCKVGQGIVSHWPGRGITKKNKIK